VENLEARQLLSAAAAPVVVPPVLDGDRILRVNGTEGSDRIIFRRIVVGDADEVKVTVNRSRWYFSTADIDQVNVSGGDDDDLVQVADDSEMLRAPFYTDGQDGSDTLSGASGADSLLGGNGDDSLVGGNGDDYLLGDAGDDTLFGGRGDDRLVGASGNDALNDDAGDNDYNGGAGRDSIKRGIAGPPEFLIGVWGQTGGSALKWKSRGMNTLVAAELYSGRLPLSDWDDKLAAAGMYGIRAASADPSDDVGKSHLVAYLAPDEPDVHRTDPETVQAYYSKLKKANPDLPVMINFSGGHVVGYQEKNWKHPYAGWLEGADWSSNDIYPVAGWNLPKRLGLVGEALDRLTAIDPSKPQFAFIEASDQGLPWNMDAPGPTPAQMRTEIWNAVIHGARGITYFVDAFKPQFSYDATTQEIRDEMKLQNTRLQDLSGVLLSKLNPKGYGIELPDGMEGTVRVYKGKVYLIVLNMSSRSKTGATITVSGVEDGEAGVYAGKRSVRIEGGQIVDDFEGYTPRVYVIG
jgi:hypothetical protein